MHINISMWEFFNFFFFFFGKCKLPTLLNSPS